MMSLHWDVNQIPSQNGRVVFITGANSGLGLETSRQLLKKGAYILLGCRNTSKAKLIKEELIKDTNNHKVDIVPIDLSDLTSVSNASNIINNKYNKLDILINNAGIMAIPRRTNDIGLELQFATNHIGHMALTIQLHSLLSQSEDARVITVSSGAQYIGRINWEDMQGYRKYNRWEAYSQSKLANAMFALELEEQQRTKETTISSLLAHPGLAKTNLQLNSIAASGAWQEKLTYKLLSPLFQSPEMGSLPLLYAATDSKAQGGQQYGPRFNFRGYPKACGIAKQALDRDARKRLWDISEEIIKRNSK